MYDNEVMGQANTQYNGSRHFYSLIVFFHVITLLWVHFRFPGDKNILVIWGRENRLVEVMQDVATCQASTKPQWLGNNKLYHMSVYSIAVTELEQTDGPVSVNISVVIVIQNTSIANNSVI